MGTRWSDACVFSPHGCGVLGPYFTLLGGAAVSGDVMQPNSHTGGTDTVMRACGGPEQVQVYYAVWVHKEGRNSGRLRGVAMHAAAEDDTHCVSHVDCHFGCFFSRP
ncbi:hypothetical protein TcCL_Unassigned02620 [Trypanosoma cruzi]|nr:hypothetical protein TcCL_Unassigned02620 [Trypanosoma cruzi]